jgi:HD superfamily phosphohydrolase
MDSYESRPKNAQSWTRSQFSDFAMSTNWPLTYLVYPGATHRRFEHSLGVMELAGQVFDVVTDPLHVSPEVMEYLPEIAEDEVRTYWRRVLRMAALCHDIGHLPFSHAAEDELLPSGWDHERLTRELIFSNHMSDIWHDITPPLRPEDIAKVAVKWTPDGEALSDWESILAEIVTGDSFGVDRIDYLFRDSHHAGVVYGKFDYLRLLDTLRITHPPITDKREEEASKEPTIGIEEGGLRVAESLAIARYLIFSEVYFHKIRRIYDIHLKDFLSLWLPDGKFSVSLDDHLAMTDEEVLVAIAEASRDTNNGAHDPARRIMSRGHFRRVFQPNPSDEVQPPDPVRAIYQGLCGEFDPQLVRQDSVQKTSTPDQFPVIVFGGKVEPALSHSTVLRQLPIPFSEAVYVAPEIFTDASRWLSANRERVLREAAERKEEIEEKEET